MRDMRKHERLQRHERHVANHAQWLYDQYSTLITDTDIADSRDSFENRTMITKHIDITESRDVIPSKTQSNLQNTVFSLKELFA